MNHETKQPQIAEFAREADPRPPYEPPRITKKRSVSRVTNQFTGSAQGIVTEGA
jgi:hypothetical protein